jgi:hypothetical protein
VSVDIIERFVFVEKIRLLLREWGVLLSIYWKCSNGIFSFSQKHIKLVPYEQADVASSVENDSWSSN